MATRMDFCLLGPLSIRVGGIDRWPEAPGEPAELTVPSGKQRAVLATLLLSANQVVPVDDLAETLWGPALPPSARVTVQNYVKRLRGALRDTDRTRISTRPPGYVIQAENDELDVLRFEASLSQARAFARARSWAQAGAEARAALALWRGEPLAGVAAEHLALRELPRLLEMRWQALETGIEADMHLGRHAEVIADLRRLTRVHSLRENLHALLMLALYRDGRQAEALEAYHQARLVLVSELGTEPGGELRELHHRILSADPALRLLDRGSGWAAPGGGPTVPRPLPGPPRHFTGRADELRALYDMLSASPGHGGTVLIVAIGGMAGAGKTALAVHWAHQVAGHFPDGQLYVNLGGYRPAGSSARPRDVIQGFLEALDVTGSAIPTSLDARSAMYRSVLAGRRMLLVLDNARDTAQVQPLLPGGGSLVVVTSRHPLTALVSAEGASSLQLRQL